MGKTACKISLCIWLTGRGTGFWPPPPCSEVGCTDIKYTSMIMPHSVSPLLFRATQALPFVSRRCHDTAPHRVESAWRSCLWTAGSEGETSRGMHRASDNFCAVQLQLGRSKPLVHKPANSLLQTRKQNRQLTLEQLLIPCNHLKNRLFANLLVSSENICSF